MLSCSLLQSDKSLHPDIDVIPLAPNNANDAPPVNNAPPIAKIPPKTAFPVPASSFSFFSLFFLSISLSLSFI